MGEEDIEGLTVGRGRAVERIAEPSSERSSAFPRLFETGELLASTRSPDRSIGQSLGRRCCSRAAGPTLVG